MIIYFKNEPMVKFWPTQPPKLGMKVTLREHVAMFSPAHPPKKPTQKSQTFPILAWFRWNLVGKSIFG